MGYPFQVYKNEEANIIYPSWENAGWLALDVVLGIMPFVPAIGKGLKGLSKVDDVVDNGKGINRLDDVHDAIVIGKGMNRVKDALEYMTPLSIAVMLL